MAYVSNRGVESPFATSTSFTPTLLPHIADDLIVLYVFQDGGGTDITTATTGWTKIGTFASSGACRGGFFYKLASGSSETAPTFAGANDEWCCIQAIVKDADTVSPIDAESSRGDWNNVSTFNSPSLTTNTDNCLILHAASGDGSVYPSPTSPAGLYLVGNYSALASSATGSAGGSVGYSNQYSSGAATTIEWGVGIATEGGNAWAIAIKNKTGGSLGPHPGGTITVIDQTINTASPLKGSYVAPDTTIASLDGITMDTTATLSSALQSSPDSLETDFRAVSSRFTGAANTTEYMSGGQFTLTTAENISEKIIGFTWSLATNWSSPAYMGAKGVVILYIDSTGNYEAFQIHSSRGWVRDVAYQFVHQPDSDTPYVTSGTVDWTSIKHIAFLVHKASGGISAPVSGWRGPLVYPKGSPIYLLGGGGNYQVTFKDAANLANGWNAGWRRGNVQAESQCAPVVGVQIGDGTVPTNFKAVGYPLSVPVLPASNAVRRYWVVPDNSYAITVYPSASCVIDFRSGLLSTTQAQTFTIHASASTSATYYWTGLVVSGPWDVTWKTGIACDGVSFSGCDEINFKGANVSNCSIISTISADAVVSWDESGATVTDTNIDVTGTSAAYHLELGTAVTAITLTDVTFTGTPGTDKVHVLKTTGTVTITISGTTTLAAGDVTSEGATVVIAGPTVNQSVTLSNLTTGSRVQIYDTTNSVELANSTAAVPGSNVVWADANTCTWTDPSAATGNRAIRVRIAYVSGAVACKQFIQANIGTCGTTSGTAAVSYLANQVDDAVYLANAVDGSAVTGITFTDAATDLVNCNIASGAVTWPTIYAAFVYWSFTETGIANDFTYIDAPDTANYLLDSMKVKNTSSPSVPLVITGGFGRDATSGLVADIIDTTGGNVYPSPDHVVAFATGSGVTAQDKIDIASQVLTAAQTAPIHSNIKYVADTVVNGTGTESDPWGP